MPHVSTENPNVRVIPGEVCRLQSGDLATLGPVWFRRSSSDGMPMLSRQLGEREAQIPLHALRREFAIDAETPDDRMLALIGAALDYVSELRPGDRLPSEVCNGEASWSPGKTHIGIAWARVALNLALWLSPGSRWARAGRDTATLERLADDPALRAELAALAVPAARHLGLAGAAEVVALVETFALELAFIEALRERLLLRVALLTKRLRDIVQQRRFTRGGMETVGQVHRLCVTALRQLASRFDDVDAQTGEASSLLQNADSQRRFIRSNRDWLYRCQRDWTPLLDRWDAEAEAGHALVADTYRFLAPKWMPAQTWQTTRQDRRRAPQAARMTW